MRNDMYDDLQKTREHLAYMIWKEKSFGEFQLASVLEDSLLYNLHDHIDSPYLSRIAYETARISVSTAIEVMNLNEFIVCESVRGVIHSMDRLGGDPIDLAEIVAAGALHAVELASNDEISDAYRNAVLNGVRSATDDMGVNYG
ncbi:hypothetical protein LSG31_00915 [Fodinisporobacter ferrooxydans]|uniref:Uncharacterized protein n=1 Tax=Fodinisporobacter ferrooxydans TaxID=2901836 RepID=A0ABY4CKL5_9BACL|nr:hypothetical protein LSG31_00915 [Alicyclobacillaceae bacterium MYW30-H2]